MKKPSGNCKAGAFRPHANKIDFDPWQTKLPQFHELDSDAGLSQPNANIWWTMSAVANGSTLAIEKNIIF